MHPKKGRKYNGGPGRLSTRSCAPMLMGEQTGEKVRRLTYLLLAAWMTTALAWAGSPELDFAAYKALLDAGTPLLLIDARAKDNFRYGHLPGAVNIPGYLFDGGKPVPGLPTDRSLTIVVYCSGDNCGVSYYVVERLLDMGYERVFVFTDGVAGWLRHNQKLLNKRHEQLPRISFPDLTARLAKNDAVQLIDARPAAEAASDTIPGAKAVAIEKLRFGSEALPARDKPVVVFGGGPWDSRPYHLADRLRLMGYKRVWLFAPGISGWRRYQSIDRT